MENSQFIEDEFQNISFIFFKPFNSDYYSYAINGLEKFHLIEREHILGFIKCQDYPTHERVLWLSSRFFPFLFNFKEKKLIELEVDESEENIQKIISEKFNIELRQKDISKEEKSSLYQEKVESLREKFKRIFRIE